MPIGAQVATLMEGGVRKLYNDQSAAFNSVTGQPTRRVYSGAARTLTADDNGALCIWSTAAGYTYTLPAAEAGLWFEFYVQTTITSVAAKVICASGDFIVGTFLQGTDGTFTTGFHDANGTTHVAWSGNGTTTGGIKGDRFKLTAISGTQWVIEGFGSATGSEATPFATS